MEKRPDEIRDMLGGALLLVLGVAGIAYALWRDLAIISALGGGGA